MPVTHVCVRIEATVAILAQGTSRPSHKSGVVRVFSQLHMLLHMIREGLLAFIVHASHDMTSNSPRYTTAPRYSTLLR